MPETGRPTKLTPEVQEKIVKAIVASNYAIVAAAAAGIDASTYHRWMQRGDPEGKAKRDAPYREFRAAVEQAKAQSEARLVTQIAVAGERHWSASAWLLSRRFPKRWDARRQAKRWRFGRSKTKNGNDQASSRRRLAAFTPSELRRMRDRALRSG